VKREDAAVPKGRHQDPAGDTEDEMDEPANEMDEPVAEYGIQDVIRDLQVVQDELAKRGLIDLSDEIRIALTVIRKTKWTTL
jgi:hypothetical protein